MLYVLNLGEEDAAKCTSASASIAKARWPGAPTPPPPRSAARSKPSSPNCRAEQRDYLASYGLKESGLERLISATYSLLGLMSFLTAGEDECRAWTIPMNSPRKAAGAIHSDFEKKFIRAEVVNWKALVDHGGYPGVREKGLLRLEGKEYIVKDGDVLVIRHSHSAPTRPAPSCGSSRRTTARTAGSGRAVRTRISGGQRHFVLREGHVYPGHDLLLNAILPDIMHHAHDAGALAALGLTIVESSASESRDGPHRAGTRARRPR
jgi:hypothetical protein